jgi:hypothetical protein
MKACRPLPMQPSKLWVWSILAAVSLAVLIAGVSIHSGPSVQHAALAIHRAQGNVCGTCGDGTGVKPSALQNAEAELSLAYVALAERRYDAAVAAATRARQLAEHCTPKRPSLGRSSFKTATARSNTHDMSTRRNLSQEV